MTVWFTSDEHYGHKNIIEYCKRPFVTVEEMNETLIIRHNAQVRPGDTVWHLGDFSMDERYVREVLPRLQGTHHLIAGNHDKCHSSRSRSEYFGRRYLEWGFESVREEVVLEMSPTVAVYCCHFPTAEDMDYDPRFGEYRPTVQPYVMLCGHVHERWKRRGPCINVGVDQWDFAPVTLETILAG